MLTSLIGKLKWDSCRQHEDKILVTAEEDSEEQQQIAAGRWDSFWGYDMVHAEGLLDKTYARLQIKQRSWSGLKEIPKVSLYQICCVNCTCSLSQAIQSL